MTTYREATSVDAAAIADLHARSWRATYRGAYSDEYLDRPVDDERRTTWTSRLNDPAPNQFVVVAEDDSKVVGFACVYGADNDEWGSFLDNIHADPTRHGEGIGTGLFFAVVDWCRRKHQSYGLHLKVLDRNHEARRFYERRGGTECGSVPASNPWVVEGTRVLLVAWPTLDAVTRPSVPADGFATPRLRLRPLTTDDAPALLPIVNDTDVTRYIPVEPQTLDSERAFIASVLAETPRLGHHFAVVESATVEVIGHARFGVAEGIGPDLSYMLRKDRWGRGFGTEVARCLVAFAFDVLGLDEIFVTCAPDNAASLHVIAKSGFSFVERVPRHMMVHGERRDSLVFRQAREDATRSRK